jgi:TPR repeat protein
MYSKIQIFWIRANRPVIIFVALILAFNSWAGHRQSSLSNKKIGIPDREELGAVETIVDWAALNLSDKTHKNLHPENKVITELFYRAMGKNKEQAMKARHKLITLYRGLEVDGLTISSDGPEVVYWATLGAALKDAQCMYVLGICYSSLVDGLALDLRKKVCLLQMAADMGYSPAFSELGVCHKLGDGGLYEDLATAISLFEKGVDKADARAQVNLGLAYLRGEGKPKDISKAFELFKLAAMQGNKRGQKELDELVRTGQF